MKNKKYSLHSFLTVLKQKKSSTIVVFAISIIVLIVGFFLRSRMILNGDFWYTSDQARDLVLARDVVLNHKFILIGVRSGIEGVFHGPLWIYMLSVPFALLHGDPQKIAYFYVAISISTLLAAFWAAWKLYGKWIALFMLIVLSFAQTQFSMINNTSNAHPLPLVTVGYIACMILFIRGKTKALIFAIFFAGLAFEFQAAFAIFLLPYTILAVLIINRKVLTIKNILIYCLAYILSLTSLVLFELRHHFLETQAVLHMLFHPGGLSPLKGYEQYGNIFFRIQDRINALIHTPGTILPSVNYFSFSLVVVIFVMAALVINKKKNNPYRKEFMFLLVFPVFVYLIYIFYPLPVWDQYTFAVPVILAFLFSLSVYVIWNNNFGKLLVSVFILYSIFVTSSNLQNMYATKYVPQSDRFFN